MTVADLERELLDRIPLPTDDQRRLASVLTALLVNGRPVEIEQLAQELAWPDARVASVLTGMRSVLRDQEGRVFSCFGLTLKDTRHRLYVGERMLHTWCAWDALLLAGVLARPVRAESSCPASSEPISVEVAPDGLRTTHPTSTVVSFILPDLSPGANPFESFCKLVNFFASRQLAETWTAQHEYLSVLSLKEAYRLAQSVTRRCLPSPTPVDIT
jgi:alkylmercury lyase